PSTQVSAAPTAGQVVGSGGGTVTDASGTTLTIPSGALTSNTIITLTTLAESDSRAAIPSGSERLIGIGPAYEFTATPSPTFNPAAKLAFAYTASQLSTAGVTHPRHLRVYTKAAATDTTWTRVTVDSVNTTTGRVYIHLTGFSVYRLAAARAAAFSSLSSITAATISTAKRVAVALVDGEPTTVSLAYRRGGTTTWQRLGMAATTASADSFAATIPAADVTDHGLEVYVKGTDATSTSDSTAISALRVAVPSLSVSVSTIGLAVADTGNVADTTFTKTQYSKFRMLSIPIALDGNRSAQTVLGSQLGIGDSKIGRIFRWNGAGYSEATSESMEPGKAFWVISRTPPSAITLGAGQSSDTRSPPSISINQNGFTQVGVPYTFSVPYDSTRAHNPTLDSRAWRWTGSGYTITALLEPWQGYWVKSTGTATTITIPPVDANATPKPLPPLTSPTGPDGWTIRVVAEAGGMQDVDNYLGVSSQAAEQWDPLDFAEPPPLGAGTVALYVPHPDWPAPMAGQYAGDFRPVNAEGYAWDVTVDAAIPRTTATVTVRDVNQVPPGFTALLIDLDHYRELNLRERAMVTFPTGETGSTRHFKLIVGSSTYIERVKATLLPRAFALEPNAPNPFNPTTTIRFALPQTVPVRLVVYNILGQEVKVLVDQVMPAGYHQVVWDGTNRSGQRVASGVYVYAIQAGSFRQSRKMALVK
ncbi:MAG: T9SS type A sorting domain-containing protein, partial [Candidatus Latescibacteria bacterium]|nr:T9SS type A sorting domain-containing protein [Candidatus Latescibacterota bacterium]